MRKREATRRKIDIWHEKRISKIVLFDTQSQVRINLVTHLNAQSQYTFQSMCSNLLINAGIPDGDQTIDLIGLIKS